MTEDTENDDKKIVQSGPHGLVKSSSGLVRRGLDDLQLRSEKEAVEKNNLGFWLQRGCDLYEEDKRAEAVSCFEKAIEIDANCKEAWVLRASCLEGLRRSRETVESLDKAIELVRSGTADYNPQQWHRSPVSWLAEQSRAILSGDSSSGAFNLYSWKGRLLMELGRFEEAIRSCDLALQLSSDAMCLNNRGTSLHGLGRYQEAIQCFDRAIAMVQEEVLLSSAWTDKGMSLYRLGRRTEAMGCYDMAISISPDLPEPWYNKGNVFRKMKNFDEAIRCYNKAIELDPEHVRRTTARSWNYKSVCLRELGRVDEAISCDEKAMSCRLNLFWYEAGLSLEGEGRAEDAIDAYEVYLADATPDEAAPSEIKFIEKARERLQALKSR